MAVIALLIAILVPALRSAKETALSTRTLSNLKGIGVVFGLYAESFDDAHPYYQGPEWLHLDPEGNMRLQTSTPWVLATNWPALFHDVAPWSEHFATWVNDGANRDAGRPWVADGQATGRSSYSYSSSFVASPGTWGGSGPAGIRATRRVEVQFPSSKVLVFDQYREYLRREAEPSDPRGVLLCDGSADSRHDDEATEPVQNQLRPNLPPRRYLDTANGVRGTDF